MDIAFAYSENFLANGASRRESKNRSKNSGILRCLDKKLSTRNHFDILKKLQNLYLFFLYSTTFIEAVDSILISLAENKFSEVEDWNVYHSFFEKMLQFAKPDIPNVVEVYQDNYRFLNYEFVLYYAAIMIQNRKFVMLSHFVNSTYFVKKYSSLESREFYKFNEHKIYFCTDLALSQIARYYFPNFPIFSTLERYFGFKKLG